MSVEVMSAVWKRSKQSGGALVVLLAIADYAGSDGIAFPSVATLAKQARMTERNAQLCLRTLVTVGELEIREGAGPHGCHLYRVLAIGPGATSSPEKIAPLKKLRGEEKSKKGVKPASPKPPVEPPTSSTSSPLPPTVERFDVAMRRVPGYLLDPIFLGKVAEKYGSLDLEEEALKIAAWLGDHRQRHYTDGFCLTWLHKALTSPPPPTPIHARTPNGRDNGFGDMSDAEIEARYAHLVVNA